MSETNNTFGFIKNFDNDFLFWDIVVANKCVSINSKDFIQSDSVIVDFFYWHS